MNYRSYFLTAFTAITVGTANLGSAQEMDVDQADSLRFGEFHTDKKAAIKAWGGKPEPAKTYTDNAGQNRTDSNSMNSTNPITSTTPIAAPSGQEIKGKRFELRERYTLTRSAQTPYSAFYVIEPLYKQAAQLCTKGWKKLGERSEPIEQDFYLYFEIECL